MLGMARMIGFMSRPESQKKSTRASFQNCRAKSVDGTVGQVKSVRVAKQGGVGGLGGRNPPP